MPKIITTILKCDLCPHQSKPDEGSNPKGWIHWSQDDYYEERSWHERYLCPKCIKDILATVERMKSKI